MSISIVCGQVSPNKIIINKNELAQRLQVKRDFENNAVDSCIDEFKKEVVYRYCYTRVPVELIDDCTIKLGELIITSRNLRSNLNNCRTALILAVTTGVGIDRLLNKMSVASTSKYFITDAIASAAVESFCDYMDLTLRNYTDKKHRFSPGYGDLSLNIQTDILDLLNANKNIGITINDSLLMTPMKSITAILGENNE